MQSSRSVGATEENTFLKRLLGILSAAVKYSSDPGSELTHSTEQSGTVFCELASERSPADEEIWISATTTAKGASISAVYFHHLSVIFSYFYHFSFSHGLHRKGGNPTTPMVFLWSFHFCCFHHSEVTSFNNRVEC